MRILKKYLMELLKTSGDKVALLLSMDVVIGLLNGIGIIMILPLLKLIGIGDSPIESNRISKIVKSVYRSMGIDMNIYNMVFTYIVIVCAFAMVKKYQTILGVIIQRNFTRRIREKLYRALVLSKWLFIQQKKLPHITHALTEDIQKIGGGTSSLLKLTSSMMLILIYISTAFLVSSSMTLFTLSLCLIAGFMVRPLIKKSFEAGNVFRDYKKDLYTKINEHIQGIKVAKSLALEESFIEKIVINNKKSDHEWVRFMKIQTNTKMLYEVTGVVAVGFYLILTVVLLNQPYEEILLFVVIVSRLSPGFSNLTRHFHSVSNMMPSFSGVVDLFDEALLEKEKATKYGKKEHIKDLEGPIIFNNVYFRYPGKEHYVINGMDLMVPANEITAITGGSGAGKSTVVDLILGLIKPERGFIEVDGEELSDRLIRSWRYSIGYVTQDVFLFNGTIRENLLWGTSGASDNQLEEVMKMVNFNYTSVGAFKVLDSPLGDGGVNLSGGEKQKLVLARTLLRKKKLLILDEATASLDKENERKIFDVLRELKEKVTIIMISHRSSTITFSDRVIRLNNGKAYVIESDHL